MDWGSLRVPEKTLVESLSGKPVIFVRRYLLLDHFSHDDHPYKSRLARQKLNQLIEEYRTMESECEVSGLPKVSCAHCRGFESKDIRAGLRVFEAKYHGYCEYLDCDDRIFPGQLIVRVDDWYEHARHH
jgi:hypothetical protein